MGLRDQLESLLARPPPLLLMPNFLSNIPLLKCMDPNSLGNGCLSFWLLPAKLGLGVHQLSTRGLVRTADVHPGEQYEEVFRGQGLVSMLLRTSLYFVDTVEINKEKVEETGANRIIGQNHCRRILD